MIEVNNYAYLVHKKSRLHYANGQGKGLVKSSPTYFFI